MKKILLSSMLVATGMLLATSCSNDESASLSSNEAQVTFSIGLDGGLGTRAISDGTSADKLVYAVYDANNVLLDKISGADENGQFVDDAAFDNALTDNVSITLAKGQTYTIVFWAQDGDCAAYNTEDLTKVTVDYSAIDNNDEAQDAFYKAETFTVSEDATINVTLKRAFAQVNVGVTDADWDAAVNSGIEIQKSTVTIKSVASEINLLTGAVANPVEVTYNLTAIPAEALNVDTDGDDAAEAYKYLSMTYVLVNDASADGAQKAVLEAVEYTFNPIAGEDIVFNLGMNNVPVQRNWRTNIVGKILTGDIEFNITIDPAFDDEDLIQIP